MTNQNLKWYAVYTRAKWEKKVADRLIRKGIELYCPLNRVIRQWSDRKKMILEPLFTSYVFVHVRESDHLRVKQTDGVINMVYWLGKPAIIKDAEIEAIRSFLDKYQNVQLEKVAVNVNDVVRIVEGPLMYMEGNVVEVLNNSVKVLLPSLGYAMVALVRRNNIENLSREQDKLILSDIKTLR